MRRGCREPGRPRRTGFGHPSTCSRAWPKDPELARSDLMNDTGLVRDPSSRLAEGIVTHISRTEVDVALARAQHAAYADALAASGWTIGQVPAADECPDSVFVGENVGLCEDLAVLTRSGAPARRAEVAGVAQTVRS